jgi:Thioredoxin
MELAKLMMPSNVEFYGVSCDKYVELCEEYNVEGYPTLRLFPQNNRHNNNDDKLGIDIDNSEVTVEKVASILKVKISTDGSSSDSGVHSSTSVLDLQNCIDGLMK